MSIYYQYIILLVIIYDYEAIINLMRESRAQLMITNIIIVAGHGHMGMGLRTVYVGDLCSAL